MPKTRWNFNTDIPAEIIIETNVRGYSDPGIHTLSNGDPGYPPERDEEREIIGARFEIMTGWDARDPKRLKPIRKIRRLNAAQVWELRDILQEIVNREDIDPAEHEPDPPEREERFECAIHGTQDGPDCPRC